MARSRISTVFCIATGLFSCVPLAGCGDDSGGTCGMYCRKAVVCATGSTSGTSWCIDDCKRTVAANEPECGTSYEALAQCFQANSCEDITGGTACGQEWMDMNAACPIEACSDYETRCDDGGCVPTDWVCDSECDCNDCSDENNCP